MDFGDLKDDKNVQIKLQNVHNSIDDISKLMNTLENADIYEKLSIKEKVDYDLFVTYTLNTLYWMYLRMQNIDPNDNLIKEQISRVKEYMLKAKQAHERNTIRPTLNTAVAARFIKHGIQHTSEDGPVLNKKIRFKDSD